MSKIQNKKFKKMKKNETIKKETIESLSKKVRQLTFQMEKRKLYQDDVNLQLSKSIDRLIDSNNGNVKAIEIDNNNYSKKLNEAIELINNHTKVINEFGNFINNNCGGVKVNIVEKTPYSYLRVFKDCS